MKNFPNKYIKVLIFVIIIFFMESCENLNNSDIYGLWIGKYKGRDVSFLFREDKTCVFKYFDEIQNTQIKISGIYDLDFSKRPIPISISNITEVNNSLHSIINFVNNDTFLLAEFSPIWRLRPISFEKEKSIELKRKLN